MEKLECKRCGHTWIPRIEGRPGQCPECHNTRWDKPRVKPIRDVVYQCKCGNRHEMQSYVPNPLAGKSICDKCGGLLWLLGKDVPDNKRKCIRKCKSCGKVIEVGSEFTTDTIDNEWGMTVLSYHTHCIPY